MKKTRRQRGFTLLEIMIALTIFAVISTLAWQILDGAMRTKLGHRCQRRKAQPASARLESDGA